MASVSKSKAFRWEILPALPTRRVYCTLVACGDLLYVLGGCDAVGNPLDSVEAWPLEGGRTWERLPPMPTARAGVGAVVMGKLVFALGGVGLYHRPVPAVEAYGADHKCWSSRSQMPEAIMGMAIAVRDCRFYLAGGMANDTSPLSSLWEYDTLHDEWKALPPMPTSRYGAVACIRGNSLYILGGRQCKQSITALESFDLDTQAWTCLPSMTSKRSFSGYVSTDDRIYSLGGLERPSLRNYHLRPTFVSTVEFFDIQQGIWLKSSKVPNMKKKRADFVAACLGGRVVVVGGLVSSQLHPDFYYSSRQSHLHTNLLAQFIHLPSVHLLHSRNPHHPVVLTNLQPLLLSLCQCHHFETVKETSQSHWDKLRHYTQ